MKIILLILIISLYYFPHDTDTEKKITSNHQVSKSKEDIAIMWEKCKPNHNGDKYEIKPSITGVYRAGVLNEQFLIDGLNMTNFCRYLANLPSDCVLDPDLNKSAQHGAVLLANSNFAHIPKRPKNMSVKFYNSALEATRNSNIAKGYNTLYESILEGWIFDEDPSNIDRLGHRRWILFPSLKNIGFGYAGEKCSTMRVVNAERRKKYEYDFVAWPSEGHFPIEFMKTDVPWSISLNPKKFKSPQKKDVKISLAHENKFTLKFDAKGPYKKGDYFKISHENYGINNCIIFRPSHLFKQYFKTVYHVSTIFSSTPQDTVELILGFRRYKDSKYTVKVAGLKTISGTDTTITYDVNFFSLKEYIANK